MTMNERSVWVQLIVMPGVAIAYFGVVFASAAGGRVEDVDWVTPMIWAISIVIAGVILGTIASAIGAHIAAEVRGEKADMEDGDIRDKEIERLGELKGRLFTGLGSFAALVLTMTRADHFWIASALFLAGTIAAMHASIVKLRAYRNGF